MATSTPLRNAAADYATPSRRDSQISHRPAKDRSKLQGAVSHHQREPFELCADRELALEYLPAAMQSLDNPQDRATTQSSSSPGTCAA